MLATKWRCFEVYITKKSVFAQNFFLFNKLEFKFHEKQKKEHVFCAIKLSTTYFSNEKEKGCFL